MRRLILWVLLAVTLLSSHAHCQSPSPIAFWPLNEVGGTTIRDSTYHRLDGIAHGGSIVDGVQGNCRWFANGAYVEVPDNNLLDLNSQLTIVFWVKDPSFDVAFPIDKRDDCGDVNYLVELCYFGPNPVAVFQFGVLPTVAYYAEVDSLRDGKWHHMAISFVFGDTASARWFVDGQVISGTWVNGDASPWEHGDGAAIPPTSTYPLQIGRQVSCGQWYYNGGMDQIRIYNRALDSVQVVAVYNEEKSHLEAAADVIYCGPKLLGDVTSMRSGCIKEEADSRITAGDNVHLRLPFTNRGERSADYVKVRIVGGDSSAVHPPVLFYGGQGGYAPPENPEEYEGYSKAIVKWLYDLQPAQTESIDVWMYVGRINPDVLPQGVDHPWSNHVDIVIDDDWSHKTTIPIEVSPVSFADIFQYCPFSWALLEDCLHHPADLNVRRYAQYAAGTPVAAQNNESDSDDLVNCVDHVRNMVRKEFLPADFVSGLYYGASRIRDIELVGRRGSTIGVCRQYTDLMTGLLRSLGLPTRGVLGFAGSFGGNHTWNEVFAEEAWILADATYNRDDSWRSTYGSQYQYILADNVTLPSRCGLFVTNCTPSCFYGAAESCWDCVCCLTLSSGQCAPKEWCYDDVTASYANSFFGMVAQHGDAVADLRMSLDAPAAAVRDTPFGVKIEISNNGDATEEHIRIHIDSEPLLTVAESLYTATPSDFQIDSLATGEHRTLESVVVPLRSGRALPLGVYARSNASFVSEGRLQDVNEPGTQPDLSVSAQVVPVAPHVGTSITISARVADDSLRSTDNAIVTSILRSTEHPEYEQTIELQYSSEDSLYESSVSIPETWPLGLYRTETVAAESGFESDTTAQYLTLGAPLYVSLAAQDTIYGVGDTILFVATVQSQGTPTIAPSLTGELRIAEQLVHLAFQADSAATGYVAKVVAAEYSDLFGIGVLPDSVWKAKVTAVWYGETASDSVQVYGRIPDLSVSDADVTAGTCSPPDTTVFRISATVRNLGKGTCQRALVRFFVDTADTSGIQIIPDQIIADVAPAGSQTVYVLWDTTSSMIPTMVHVLVDPTNSVIETDKANDYCSKELSLISVTDETPLGVGRYLEVRSYPNPFNPVATIIFDVPQQSSIKLWVYDIAGRVVATLVDREMTAGSHRILWDGKNNRGIGLASGIYLLRLEAGDFVATRKMVLLR
jgi:hypothetical protein